MGPDTIRTVQWSAGVQTQILQSIYPEIGAGGFSRVDGSVEFYTRVNALLRPAMTVVDYGAGRGEWIGDNVAYRRQLRMLRGKVAEVVGVDVDDAVAQNDSVDRFVIADDPRRIPLDDRSVDLVVSDHTFEHIDYPAEIARELERIIRPGGWICARTPNRWGYIALATSVIPNRRHVGALHTLQPDRNSVDVFPTRYRLNTRRAVTRHFPPDRWENFSYFWSGEPSYFGRSRRLAKALKVNAKLPDLLQPKLFVFLHRKYQT